LPPSASAYERALAICADDVLVEIQSRHFVKGTIKDEYKNSGILDSLKSILTKVLNRRAHMTLRESARNQFDRAVYSIIKSYVTQMYVILKHPPSNDEHAYVLHVETEIAELLAPWFVFRLLETTGGRILIQLRSLFTHTVYQDDPYFREHTPIAAPVAQCFESARVIMLDRFLDLLREEILKGNTPLPEDLAFVRPFRQFLESGGDPNYMPIIRSGARNRRELTLLGVYQSGRMKCKPNCECPLPQVIKMMEQKLAARLSQDPKAVVEREVIKRFFRFIEIS